MLKNLKLEQAGLSIYGNFVGAAAHADDLRTIAASKCSVQEQVDIINKFTSRNHLKLNSSKTEIIKISYHCPTEDSISLASTNIDIISEAKCLGVWWKYNLSAVSLYKKISPKQEEPFLLLEGLMHFKVT